MEGRMGEAKAVWGQEHAESYARWMRVGSRLFYAPLARQAVELLPPVETGSAIVDLGCGPGLLGVELCKAVPQAKVIGVDPSAEMLEVARRNADQAGVTNYETRLGRAERIPMRSSSVCLVVSQSSLHEWDDPREGLSEVFRVLEVGGSLILKDYNRTWLSPWKRALVGRFHHLRMFKFSFGDVADLVRGAGFDEVRGQDGGVQFLVQAVKTADQGSRRAELEGSHPDSRAMCQEGVER
jgi:ubiquinone/menaquinone biosynthesis C-methylase UbiE